MIRDAPGRLVHRRQPERGAPGSQGDGQAGPGPQGSPRFLVAYNIPFRDCSQFSAGGARRARPSTWPGSTRSPMASGRPRPSSSSSPTVSGSSRGTTPSAIETAAVRPRVVPAGRGRSRDGGEVISDSPSSARRSIGSGSSEGPRSTLDGTAQRVARLRRRRRAPRQGRRAQCRGLLHERLELPGGRAPESSTPPGPSECIAFANNADEGGWRLGHYEWCASQYFPAEPEATSRRWHLLRRVVCREPWRGDADGPFRHRQQPERPGAMGPAGRSPGRRPAGLVQPARPRHGDAPDRQDRGRRSSTPTCGSRSRASPTASATAGRHRAARDPVRGMVGSAAGALVPGDGPGTGA